MEGETNANINMQIISSINFYIQHTNRAGILNNRIHEFE